VAVTVATAWPMIDAMSDVKQKIVRLSGDR
jgi:hypothetical protein